MAKPAQVPALGPDTPARDAGRLLVRARLGDVLRREAAANALDPDGVHDMRVAVRRLRAALKLFGGRRHRELDAALRRLQDALGALRDLQVQLAWVDSEARQLRLSPRERARLRAWFSEDGTRQAHEARLRRELRRWSDDVAPEVERAAADLRRRGSLGGARMRRRLRKRARQVDRRAEPVRAEVAPRPAHQLRIAAKKARYAAELLDAGFPEQVGPLLARLTPLQETLGALHDADVRSERLREVERGASASDRRVARRVLAQVAPQRERLAAELAAELGRGGRFSASRRSRPAS